MHAQRDVDLFTAMACERPYCPAETMHAEDPLFLLYTSGSTGKPKGLLHTTGGYLLYAAMTHQVRRLARARVVAALTARMMQHVFDYRDGDVYACMADIGWITGHSYIVYGPLANGATTVLFESIPTYPHVDRYWETVARLGISQLYTAPTAIRTLLKHGDEPVRRHDRSRLRVLGSVGEPINPEAWHWYHDVVGEGRCTVVDTWWQTGACVQTS